MKKNKENKINYWLWIVLILINLYFIVNKGLTQDLIAVHDKINSLYKYHTSLTNVKELEMVLDWFFQDRMKKLHIPGAVIVVVKEDSILLKKGYGFSNIEKQLAADPDKTFFRVGSISKLFTVTAVMQLVEKGMLNLDDDVNAHLKHLKIKNQFPNPVTIANLLTHTAGFDHHQIGKHARTPSEIQPLHVYLREHMPKLFFNPGEYISYSNYGISLAGYLVEEISGVSFAQYMNENIFRPLEMFHSRFSHPIKLEPDLATGYKYVNGMYQPFPKEYLNYLPAGALVTTAKDIAHFMIAHLQNGHYKDVQLLKEETIREMHEQKITAHPKLPGWCYGFYESYKNGLRAIYHSGHTRGFSSLLYLIPEKKLGVFLSCNASNSGLSSDFINLFLDHYFPSFHRNDVNVQNKYPRARYERFVGKYSFNNLPKFTIAKLSNLNRPDSEIQVVSQNDGTLKVELSDRSLILYEVEPLVFKIMGDDGYVVFNENEDGNITHIFLTLDKPMTLEKMAWWESIKHQIKFFRAFYLIFFYSIIIFLLYYFTTKQTSKLEIMFAIIICAINLTFLIGLDSLYNSGELRFGIHSGLIALLCLPIVSSLLSIGLPVFAFRMWKTARVSLGLRLHYLLLMFSVLTFIPFLNYWNLLGFKF